MYFKKDMIEIIQEAKANTLSLLTDKNVGSLQLEGKEEEFGALLAYNKAFHEISIVFEDVIFKVLTK